MMLGGDKIACQDWGAHAFCVLVTPTAFASHELPTNGRVDVLQSKLVAAECGDQHAASVRSQIRGIASGLRRHSD
jgi:hypothetical protein